MILFEASYGIKGRIEAPNSLPVAASLVGGWGEILMWLSVKYLELVRISKKQAGTLKVHFETLKMHKNLKTIGAYTESTDLICKAFKKIIHLVTLSL
jgi:hypothetical protein